MYLPPEADFFLCLTVFVQFLLLKQHIFKGFVDLKPPKFSAYGGQSPRTILDSPPSRGHFSDFVILAVPPETPPKSQNPPRLGGQSSGGNTAPRGVWSRGAFPPENRKCPPSRGGDLRSLLYAFCIHLYAFTFSSEQICSDEKNMLQISSELI